LITVIHTDIIKIIFMKLLVMFF